MKRVADLILALILVLPVTVAVLVLSMMIVMVDRYRPLFLLKRPGRWGRSFVIFKLQTMRPPDDPAHIADRQRDRERVTRLGAYLRRHGLDELPQVYNILLGDMSFVGPRPLTLRAIEQTLQNSSSKEVCDEWLRMRQAVRPGLSSWVHIHQRDVQGARTIELDLEYLRRPSLQKQLKVFLVSIYLMIVGKRWHFKQGAS